MTFQFTIYDDDGNKMMESSLLPENAKFVFDYKDREVTVENTVTKLKT